MENSMRIINECAVKKMDSINKSGIQMAPYEFDNTESLNASIDPINNDVLVRVVAKSSMELTDSVRSVINSIKTSKGIIGTADIYTTMEMC